MKASSQRSGLLFGRYRLVRELGRTEAGTLFEALDSHGNQFEIGKRFAVEVANALPDEAARERFLRDARLAQRLTGPHVLRIVQVATDHAGTPCVVREPSYSDVEIEAAKGPIPVSQAVEWTLQICEALAEGHAMGLAHGDVRPANVMIAHGEDGAIAKLCWTSAAKADGVVTEDVGRDIAGAANILKVLATGVIGSVAEADQAPTLPQGIAGIVARALSSERHYATVGDLANAISRYAPEGNRSAKEIAILLSQRAVVAPARPAASSIGDDWFATPPDAHDDDTLPARRSWPFYALVSALLLMTVGGTYAAWRMGAQEDVPRLAASQALTSEDTKTNESALRTTSEGIDGRSAELAKRIQPKVEPVVIWSPVTQEPVGSSTLTSATIDVGQPHPEAPAEPAPDEKEKETPTPPQE